MNQDRPTCEICGREVPDYYCYSNGCCGERCRRLMYKQTRLHEFAVGWLLHQQPRLVRVGGMVLSPAPSVDRAAWPPRDEP